jgi:Ca2+-binding RTX toxin-like protein
MNYSQTVDTWGGQSGSGVWTMSGGLPVVLGVHTNGLSDDAPGFLFRIWFNGGLVINKPTYDAIVNDMKASTENVAGALPFNEIIGDEPLLGFGGHDNIVGSYRREIIHGRAGDDILEGKGGDDVLFGGPGTDMAVFSEDFANYDHVLDTANGRLVLFHNKGSMADSNDTLFDVEFARFGDGLIVPVPLDDGPKQTETDDVKDANGDKIGTLSLTTPAYMFDGDADFELVIGSRQGIQFNFAYIIDISGSMIGTPLQQAKNAYVALINSLIASSVASTSQFAVIPFSSGAQTFAPLTAQQAIARIQGLSAGGSTNFGPALSQAQTFFSQQSGGATNIAYFLSDGFGTGASASLQAFAEVRAFGIGSADLNQLDIIDSDNAVLLRDANDLVSEFQSSGISRDQISRIELLLENTVVQTFAPGALTDQPLGLTLKGQIGNLEVSKNADNDVTARLVFSDGRPPATVAVEITTGQEDVVKQLPGGGVKVFLGLTNKNYTGGAGDDVIVGNKQSNTLAGGGGENQLIGDAGDDRFIVTGGKNLINGGPGVDTVVFNTTLAQAGSVSKTGEVVRVGTDHTLLEVEFIEFTDQRIAVSSLSSFPAITLVDTAVNVDEGNAGAKAVTINLQLSSAAPRVVTIDYATTAGTATDGQDFTPASGQLVIPAGQTAGSVQVNVLGDSAAESDETLFMTFSNPQNASFADGTPSAQALVTILDDDSAVSVSTPGQVSEFVEGNASNPTTVTLTFERIGDVRQPASVRYQVGPTGTAPANAADFVGGFSSGVANFPAGADKVEIPIRFAGDQTIEQDETFVVTLSSPVGIKQVPADPFQFTILNDDSSGPVGASTLSFNTTSQGVIVDLVARVAVGPEIGTVNFGFFENSTGGNGNDFLFGTGKANTLNGNDGTDVFASYSGNDVLNGNGGPDVFFSGDGDDQQFGGAGKDNFFGDFGADLFDGGPDADLANYERSVTGISVDLFNKIGRGGGDDAGDRYVSIESIRGTNLVDIIIGDLLDNVLEGNDGDDILIGSVGADILAGGPGRETFAISSVAEGGDIIADFNPAIGEVIDLRTLFDAHGLSRADPVGQGILAVAPLFGLHAVVNLDLDGAAGPSLPFTLYTLVHVLPQQLDFNTHFDW